MKLLLDTSALVQRYVPEAGHDQVAAALAKAHSLYVAAHCKLEIFATLDRLRRERWLDEAGYARIAAELRENFAGMRSVDLDAAVEAAAMAAIERSGIPGMDAVHIGSAQVARVDLFMTADRRQAAAAEAAGLAVQLVEA